MIDLDKLQRLAKAATPGPWRMVDARAFVDDEDFEIRNGQHCIGYGTAEDDAAYIVAACNALPELIARVRELERQKRVLVEKMAIDILCSECPVSEACPYENATFIELEDCAKQLEKWSENAAKEGEE